MSQIIWHKKDLIWLLGGVLLAALVIYLTPLKNLNIIWDKKWGLFWAFGRQWSRENYNF